MNDINQTIENSSKRWKSASMFWALQRFKDRAEFAPHPKWRHKGVGTVLPFNNNFLQAISGHIRVSYLCTSSGQDHKLGHKTCLHEESGHLVQLY